MAIDEYTRKCLALEVLRSFTAQDVVEVLQYLFAVRGRPEHLRSDNGPEFVAQAVCRWALTLNLTGKSKVLLTKLPNSLQGHGRGAVTTINIGNFEMTGGDIDGNLTNISANFTLLGNPSTVFGSHLTNQGTITQSGNREVQIGRLGSLVNAVNGVYDVTDAGSITAAWCVQTRG